MKSSQKRWVILISLDVNCARWDKTIEALEERSRPDNKVNIFRDYLRNRYVIMSSIRHKSAEVSRGAQTVECPLIIKMIINLLIF